MPAGDRSLLLPTTIFHDRMDLKVATTQVELLRTNIHSKDARVLWLPARGCSCAADGSLNRPDPVDR